MKIFMQISQPLLFRYPKLQARPDKASCFFGQHGCVRFISLHCSEEKKARNKQIIIKQGL